MLWWIRAWRLRVSIRRRPARWSLFFQAEDGIRDIGVTGVQTCALPISPGSEEHPARLELERQRAVGRRWAGPGHLVQRLARAARPAGDRAGVARPAGGVGGRRSEERRGGKECGSRWSPYHSKKKTRH